MGQGSRWAFCSIPPDRVKLAVNSKKNKQQGHNGQRVKMAQGSYWASAIYPLKESKWGKDHYGLLLFAPWQSEQQDRNKQQGQNGLTVKMGFCYLPPERVKMRLLLFTPWQSHTNSEQQKETNSRVKMGNESKWAKGQDGLLSFTPWQRQTGSEQQEKQTAGSKWAKGQDGLLLFKPWKSQNVLLLFTPWQSQTNWTARKKQRVGSNSAMRSRVGPGPFWLGDNRVKLGQKESSWARTILTRSQIGPRSQNGLEHYHKRITKSYWRGPPMRISD